MTTIEPPPAAELDARYSEPGATAGDWAEAEELLRRAEIFWLATVRPQGGGPHVTPLLAVWLDGALWFTTGREERKARNLAANPRVTLTTGTNTLRTGTDVVVEGEARRETDETVLGTLVEAYVAKYGEEWRFTVADGALHHGGGSPALAFRVRPETVFAFGKGPYRQTRWRL